jgi:hypothetical protein
MNSTPPSESGHTSLGAKAIAVLVLLVAAWVLLHFIVHIALAIASVAVIVVAIVALIWALRVVL